MQPSRKKICLIVCGSLPGIPGGQVELWLKQLPELSIVADTDAIQLVTGHSVDASPALWAQLAAAIHARINKYAGFVVIHDADTLLYASAAISFLLRNFQRPILFTGTHPGLPERQQLSIRANVINAVHVACGDFTDVGIVFGNRLLRANQASPARLPSLNVFDAPAGAVVGRVDFGIRIFDPITDSKRAKRGKPVFQKKLNLNVGVMRLSPFLPADDLVSELGTRDAVVLDAGDYATIPQQIIEARKRARQRVSLVVWCPQYTGDDPAQMIIIRTITWHATVAKTMWACAEKRSLSALKDALEVDLAGEVIR